MKYDELKRIYDLPFFELFQKAREVHVANWSADEIQLCTLLSIKTGGCSEDCSYCSQSSRHQSEIQREPLMELDAVMQRATAARDSGATRFCMGAAWKGVQTGTRQFNEVLEIVRNVAKLNMEVCVTLGELGPDEAKQLKDAGVTAYNHNLDTSREHYPNIVTSHTYDDRLKTIRHAQDAGMSVCCGGILGLGETVEDRLKMIEVISEFNPQPESVPINSLMPMPGTPLAEAHSVDIFDVVKMVAVARIACPKAKVRLSAGRSQMSEEGQTMCFFAGANSIFYGEKLLTTENSAIQRDLSLISKLEINPLKPNPEMNSPEVECDKELAPCCQ
ncbi:MAG: biotin synthase BioB [Verrucomicrobiae bacterium]|nr:biotin synthase BioB [Verrucomicrobiae bacterium]NNJ44303.1 biotin synthase BioB [Akkermansiaceae bacterium]